MLAYLLLRDNIQTGPYSLEELKEAGIRSTDMLWIEGRSSAWRYVDEIEELRAFVDADKVNGESSPNSKNGLYIHHEEDDGKILKQNNQSVYSSFLQAELSTKKDEKAEEENNQLLKNKPIDTEPEKIVSRRSLEIRKRLLARKKSQDSAESPSIADEKDTINEANTTSSKLIKVIIADDHTLFREGVKMALVQKKDIQIAGEAENGVQLMHQLKHNRPDVILLDIQMPLMDGISALTSIRRLYGDVKVIILSMHEGHSMISKLMQSGANAYLTKTADPETIYQAIKTCYEKNYYFNEITNVSILEGLRSKNNIPDRTVSPEFDGAQLMMQLTAAQKKSARRSSHRAKKRFLTAGFFVLLIASGVVAGLSVMSHPQLVKASTEVPTSKAASLPPSTNAHTVTLPQTQPVDSLQKNEKKVVNVEKENSLLQDDKKPITLKHKQAKGSDSFKTPASLTIIPNTDSIAKANNAAAAKKASLSTGDELKEIARSSIRNLVTVSLNDYHKGLFGGLSDIQLTVNNRSAYTIDDVAIEVQYLLAGSKLYKTETLHFQNISASSSLVLEAPKSSRGVKIDYHISSVRSKEIGL